MSHELSVMRELERIGLLLLHDKRLPSVSLLVAGEPVAGSWWSHPRGAEIFRVSEAIDDREDVVAVKLVARKVTFVHRPLWPALVGVGKSGEPWQTKGLSSGARKLWRSVEAQGADIPSSGPEARQLEERLLVLSRQFHTESGRHAKRLESWDSFATRTATAALPADEAQAILERAARELGERARLPWHG